MDLEEKKYWIAFNVFWEIGPTRFKLLCDFFGSAKKAFTATDGQLRKIGLGEKPVNSFLSFRKSFNFDSYYLRLKKLRIEVICLEDNNYPKLLREISNPPFLFYVKIKDTAYINKLFKRKAIAVVGTRKITDYGKQVTRKITSDLVAKDFVIVSGLARGVDKVAHETTINSKGLTFAVLGCGLDIVYPPEHADLEEKIIESGGMIIGEFPLGTPPNPENFPLRNRIISGLSLGVVVTEAAEKSGSLITASCAAEQGREVFAIPGPITSSLSLGNSELLKKGAKVVTKVEDILEELSVL